MVLGVLAAGLLVFQTGKSYTGTATIWVDTAPPVPSSASSNSTPLSSAPAAAEQGILTELLTTNAFAISVAQNSLLGQQLGGAAGIKANAAGALEQGQVVPTISGQQVLKISYTGPSPAIATSTVGAIASQLRQYNDGLTGQHDQAAVAYDKQQVQTASNALTAARNALNAYLLQHPKAGQTDPNFQALSSAESNADNRLGAADTALSQAIAARTSGGWTMQLIDHPTVFTVATGKKKMLEEILGGLLGGALVSFLAVIALTPARKESWDDDLPTGSSVPRGMGTDSFDGSSVPPAPAPELSFERRFILPASHREHH